MRRGDSSKRLQILPKTTSCVKCSNTNRYVGHLVVNHKTGNEFEVIKDPNLASEIQRLENSRGQS